MISMLSILSKVYSPIMMDEYTFFVLKYTILIDSICLKSAYLLYKMKMTNKKHY